MAPTELLVWTENYWIGGCDRFLADLIQGLEDRQVKISLAGNENADFDAWLASRVPAVLPRETLSIANLVRSPLHALERRLLRSGERSYAPSGDGTPAESPLAREFAVAAIRYGQDVANLRRLRELMRRRRPDVLLINNGGYPGAESCRLVGLAARAAGIPRVVHFVHNMANRPAWPQTLENVLDRRIDAATDLWITAAQRATDALADRRAIASQRITTVHYGLTPPPAPTGLDRSALRTELGYEDDALALVAVANLEPRKGIGVLLKTLATLRDGGVAVRTAIIGDGPLKSALRAQASELQLDHLVRFTGWRDDVDDALSVSDALVLPSLSHECLPYVILEAMGHRLPVISTDVAGIPEMVLDGVTGRVVPPGDSVALAEALRGVTSSGDRVRDLGERGFERLRKHFTLEQMTAKMAAALCIGDPAL